MIETGVLVWKSKNIKSYQPFFFYFGSNMHKAKWWNHVSYGFSYIECQFCREFMEEGGWKLSNPISIRWLGHLNPNFCYCITEAYPVLKHWWVVDAILIFCWKTACFITLLSFTQHFHVADLYPIRIHCWGIPYLNTLLSNSQILIHCWAIPNPSTLLIYSLS